MLLIIIYKNKRLRGGGISCFTVFDTKMRLRTNEGTNFESGIQGHT